MPSVKRVLCVIFLAILLKPAYVQAQQEEIQQLLLNVEKLAQLKQILQNMYKGYHILHGGYTAIKDISEGNFNIHQTFLDGLLAVSPTVRKYRRVADIIDYQIRIVKECKAAANRFGQDQNFTPKEIEYMGQVFKRLYDLSLKNLDDLATIMTAGKLRMSDDERIQAIDRIFSEVEDEWTFLKQFNNTAKLLAQARAKEGADINLSKKLSGVK